MEVPNDRSDYYVANAARLSTLANRIEYLLDNAQSQTVVMQEPHASPILIEGAYSGDDMRAAYEETGAEVSVEEAEELAAIENNKQRAIADQEIQAARTLVCRRAILDRNTETPYDTATGEELFWGFSQARWRKASFYTDEGLELTISSVSFDDSITRREEGTRRIIVDDGSLLEMLNLTKIDNVIRHVGFEIRQVDDELLNRCVKILGRHHSRVTLLIGGHFEDEAELDAVLNELWADLQTTAAEEEVGYLLDEVRQRALAARQATELHIMHGLGMPYQDKLAKFEQALT